MFAFMVLLWTRKLYDNMCITSYKMSQLGYNYFDIFKIWLFGDRGRGLKIIMLYRITVI